MIERGHDGESLPRRQLLGLLSPVLGGAAGKHDLTPPALDALDLHRRRGFGHDDHGAHAELLGGVGDGLAVIAARVGDHAVLAHGMGQLADRVVGAPDLESTDGLLVLELQVRAESFDVAQRRAGRDATQPGGGFLDLLGGDHPTSWSIWAWAWPWLWPSARRRSPRPPRRPLPSPRARRPRPGRPRSGS